MKTHAQTSPYVSPWPLAVRVRSWAWEIVWAVCCGWTPKPLNPWRLLWLRLFGATIRGRPFVHQRARIQMPWHLTLHDRACLGDRATAYALAEIVLGEGATAAQEVYLCTGTHQFSDPLLPLQTAPITLAPHAFVGLRAIVLPGINVGAGAVVGAGSVVTREVAPLTVVAGNPARKIGERPAAACPPPDRPAVSS